MEIKENLAVSFLCDRKTTEISKAQPGFCDFIVKPMFTQLVKLMPKMSQSLENIV